MQTQLNSGPFIASPLTDLYSCSRGRRVLPGVSTQGHPYRIPFLVAVDFFRFAALRASFAYEQSHHALGQAARRNTSLYWE